MANNNSNTDENKIQEFDQVKSNLRQLKQRILNLQSKYGKVKKISDALRDINNQHSILNAELLIAQTENDTVRLHNITEGGIFGLKRQIEELESLKASENQRRILQTDQGYMAEKEKIYKNPSLDPAIQSVEKDIDLKTNQDEEIKKAFDEKNPDYQKIWDEKNAKISSDAWKKYIEEHPEKAEIYRTSHEPLRKTLEAIRQEQLKQQTTAETKTIKDEPSFNDRINNPENGLHARVFKDGPESMTLEEYNNKAKPVWEEMEKEFREKNPDISKKYPKQEEEKEEKKDLLDRGKEAYDQYKQIKKVEDVLEKEKLQREGLRTSSNQPEDIQAEETGAEPEESIEWENPEEAETIEQEGPQEAEGPSETEAEAPGREIPEAPESVGEAEGAEAAEAEASAVEAEAGAAESAEAASAAEGAAGIGEAAGGAEAAAGAAEAGGAAAGAAEAGAVGAGALEAGAAAGGVGAAGAAGTAGAAVATGGAGTAAAAGAAAGIGAFGVIVIVIVIIIILIVLIIIIASAVPSLFGQSQVPVCGESVTGSATTPGAGGGSSSWSCNGTRANDVKSNGELCYYIPLKDTSVIPSAQVKQNIQNVIRYTYGGQYGNWDYIVNQSIAHNINPSLVLAIWLEETHGQNTTGRVFYSSCNNAYMTYTSALGCNVCNANPNNSSSTHFIGPALTCFANSTSLRRGLQQADPVQGFFTFMCTYYLGHYPCNYGSSNFPINVEYWYRRLNPGADLSYSGSGVAVPTPVPTAIACVTATPNAPTPTQAAGGGGGGGGSSGECTARSVDLSGVVTWASTITSAVSWSSTYGSYSYLGRSFSSSGYTASSSSYYLCTYLVVDSYRLHGIGGMTRGKDGGVTNMMKYTFMPQTNGYKWLQYYGANHKNALQNLHAGYAIFWSQTMYQNGHEHVGIIRSVNLNCSTGNGTLTTYESNASTKSRTLTVSGWNVVPSSLSGMTLRGFGGR